MTPELALTQQPRTNRESTRAAIQDVVLERASPDVERSAGGFTCDHGTFEAPDRETLSR